MGREKTGMTVYEDLLYRGVNLFETGLLLFSSRVLTAFVDVR